MLGRTSEEKKEVGATTADYLEKPWKLSCVPEGLPGLVLRQEGGNCSLAAFQPRFCNCA